MFLNSQYDAVGLETSMGMSCMSPGVSGMTLSKCNEKEMSQIEGYRAEYLRTVTDIV